MLNKNSDARVCAIIPARGGSKGIINKNIRKVNGRPLISYSIEAAQACQDIGACIVSTDSREIAEIASGAGAEVIMRPKELAGDASRSEDVVLHVLDIMEGQARLPEHIILLQPTSPLRTAVHVTEALEKYRSEGAYSCFSVTESEHHPYKCFIENDGEIKPLRDVVSLSMPRQRLPKVLRQNGAIYIVNAREFRRANTFYIEPVAFYQMDGDVSLDIDTEFDLDLAESRLLHRSN